MLTYEVKKLPGVPLYEGLYRCIRRDILAGNLKPGEKLPSKRALAEETGVSTVTVEHAYGLLCDEGYVEARQRSGYVVIFRKKDGFAAGVLSATPIPATDLQASPDFPLSVLCKAVRKVLAEHGDLLLAKSPNCGSLALREAIGQYLARNRGIRVDVEAKEYTIDGLVDGLVEALS